MAIALVVFEKMEICVNTAQVLSLVYDKERQTLSIMMPLREACINVQGEHAYSIYLNIKSLMSSTPTTPPPMRPFGIS